MQFESFPEIQDYLSMEMQNVELSLQKFVILLNFHPE